MDSVEPVMKSASSAVRNTTPRAMSCAVPADVLEKIIARIPRGRLGTAQDIARGVVFLTADEADFITGSTLSINGGQHMY